MDWSLKLIKLNIRHTIWIKISAYYFCILCINLEEEIEATPCKRIGTIIDFTHGDLTNKYYKHNHSQMIKEKKIRGKKGQELNKDRLNRKWKGQGS